MSLLTQYLTAQRNSGPTLFELEGKAVRPCPFCKSQELAVEHDEDDIHWAHCLTCGAEGPIASTRRFAIDLWQQGANWLLK